MSRVCNTVPIFSLRHRSAETCGGCDQPRSDVGVLVPYRVTFRTGNAAVVDYCDACAELARLSIDRPGEAFGAMALPVTIAHVAQLTVAKFEVLLTLTVAGAQFLAGAAGLRFAAESEVRLIVEATSSLDAARIAADLGTVVYVIPERDERALWVARKEALRRQHPNCCWCDHAIDNVEQTRTVMTDVGERLVHALRPCIALFTAYQNVEAELADQAMGRAS